MVGLVGELVVDSLELAAGAWVLAAEVPRGEFVVAGASGASMALVLPSPGVSLLVSDMVVLLCIGERERSRGGHWGKRRRNIL